MSAGCTQAYERAKATAMQRLQERNTQAARGGGPEAAVMTGANGSVVIGSESMEPRASNMPPEATRPAPPPTPDQDIEAPAPPSEDKPELLFAIVPCDPPFTSVSCMAGHDRGTAVHISRAKGEAQ